MSNINKLLLESILLANCPTLTKQIIDPYWAKIISAYNSMYNINLEYMKYELSLEPRTNDGNISTMPKSHYGGCWTKNKIIYINPEFKNAVMYYTKNKHISSISKFMERVYLIIAHELAHEVYNRGQPEFVDKILSKAKSKKFTSDYIQVLPNNFTKMNEEIFCEYLAKTIVDFIFDK